MNTLSADRINRILDSIKETQRQIDREMGYMEIHRNMVAIARWNAHIVKLQNMLKGE